MVTKIEREHLERDNERGELRSMMNEYDTRAINRLPSSPKGFNSTLSRLMISVKDRCIDDPGAAMLESWEAVVAAMQVGSALFASAMTPPGQSVDCRIAHEVRTIPGAGPTYASDAGNWLNAFWLAIVCREQDRMTQLCHVPIELLRASGAEYDEYIYHWIDALQTYWLERPGLGDKIVAAYEQSLPENLHIAPAELVLKITSSPIDLFYRFLTRDPETFNTSLIQALQLHKEYWTANEERIEQSVDGAIALGPLALACLAHDAGRPITVESPYVPEHLLKRSWIGEFPT